MEGGDAVGRSDFGTVSAGSASMGGQLGTLVWLHLRIVAGTRYATFINMCRG